MIDFDDYTKRSCLHCKHLDKKITDEPCYSCSENNSKWENDNERSNKSENC